MSKWDKLITRICNLSKDLRFDELRKVLESYGYEMNAPRSGSSHYTFRKQGCMPITIPKHEPIKKVYVEMESIFPDIGKLRIRNECTKKWKQSLHFQKARVYANYNTKA